MAPQDPAWFGLPASYLQLKHLICSSFIAILSGWGLLEPELNSMGIIKIRFFRCDGTPFLLHNLSILFRPPTLRLPISCTGTIPIEHAPILTDDVAGSCNLFIVLRSLNMGFNNDFYGGYDFILCPGCRLPLGSCPCSHLRSLCNIYAAIAVLIPLIPSHYPWTSNSKSQPPSLSGRDNLISIQSIIGGFYLDEHSTTNTVDEQRSKENQKRIDLEGPLWKGILILFSVDAQQFPKLYQWHHQQHHLGRMIGISALAAVSAFFLSFLSGIFCDRHRRRSSVLIGQAFGAGMEEGKVIVGTLTSTFCSVCFWPSLDCSSPQPVELTGTPADIIETSAGFVIIFGYARAFLQCLYNIHADPGILQPFYFLLITQFWISCLFPPRYRWGSACYGVNGGPGQCYFWPLYLCDFSNLPEQNKSPLQLIGNHKPSTDRLAYFQALDQYQHPHQHPDGHDLLQLWQSSFVNSFGSNATALRGSQPVVSYVQMPAGSLGIAVSIFGAQAISSTIKIE